MDQDSQTQPDAGVTAQPFAMRLAAALIAAFVLVVVLSFADRAGRAQVEAAQDAGPVVRSR